MFLHSGALHIVLNMLALLDLGRLAESLFGPAKFLAIYLVCGACSMLATSVWYVHVLKEPGEQVTPVVGASGAIFGIGGLLVVFLMRAGTGRGRAIAVSLGRSLLLMLAIGFLVPFISNTAHVGGLVAGMAFGFAIRESFRGRIDVASQRRWSVAATICVVAVAAALVAGLWYSFTHVGGSR
jgi:membrane associated rhomboid family serine protease